ncbi:MAG: hypothetical protein KDA91_04540 [Planctomycetaceae bacterium]|nr:hypothetical protein [Planctomycetaceae bacterium]
MKRADFTSPAARLEEALRQLESVWAATKEHWDDPVSQRVEEEFLQPLHSQVRCMLDAATKLSQVVRKAEHECSHPREHRNML